MALPALKTRSKAPELARPPVRGFLFGAGAYTKNAPGHWVHPEDRIYSIPVRNQSML